MEGGCKSQPAWYIHTSAQQSHHPTSDSTYDSVHKPGPSPLYSAQVKNNVSCRPAPSQVRTANFTSTAINQQALLLGAYQTVCDLSHASYFSHNFTRPTQFLRDSQRRIWLRSVNHDRIYCLRTDEDKITALHVAYVRYQSSQFSNHDKKTVTGKDIPPYKHPDELEAT